MRSLRLRAAIAVSALLVVTLVGACARQVSGTASPLADASGQSQSAAPTTTAAVSTSPLLESAPFAGGRGFALQAPIGWRADTGRGAEVVFFSPVPDIVGGWRFEPNIFVLARPTTAPLTEVVSGVKAEILAQFPALQVSVDQAATTLSGLPAHLFGGTFTDPTKLPGQVRDLRLIVVDGPTAYVITGTSLAATFTQHEPAFRASLLSFTSRR